MNTFARELYHSDLTDPQWIIVEPLVPGAKAGGRPRDVDMREVINTILYLNRTGCQWDMLPHDLLPKSTVYDYFAEWRDDGTWQRMMDALREQTRVAAGREPTPSAASIDSQSVKTTEVGGERGDDGAKKVTGRKRHIVVDTLGLLLAVTVTTAALDDAAAAPRVLAQVQPEAFPRLKKVWADQKYHNHNLRRWLAHERPQSEAFPCLKKVWDDQKYYNHNLRRWLAHERPQWDLEIVSRPSEAKGFVLLPKRWVAERTFGWNGRCRRHSRDYERRTDSSESMVKISAIHLMLRRLAPSYDVPKFQYRLAT